MDLYSPSPQMEAVFPCVTQICRLSFPDGQIASAQIEARSRYQECPVTYSGATGRLPFRYDTADSVLLRVMFQSFARELRARFEEELIGSWELPLEADEAENAYPGEMIDPARRE